VSEAGLAAGTLCRCLVLQTSLLWASASAGADIRHIDVHHEDERYFLSLEAFIDAPPLAVFAVITDYENIDRLHRRVRESRVLRRIDGRTVEVYTLMKGCVAAIFCKSLERVERVEETPPGELVATVIPEQSDFASGSVRWRLEAEGTGTRLRYDSEMDPDFWVPAILGDGLLQMSIKRTTKDMIRQVEVQARSLAIGGGEPWIERQ